MKNNIYYLLVVAVLINISSCTQLIEVDLPKDVLSTEKVFADSLSAEAAIMGVYSTISYGKGGFNLLLNYYPSISSDQMYPIGGNTTDQQFYDNKLDSENSMVRTIWSEIYSSIYNFNACIEGLENSTNLSSAQQKTLIAEMKCLRALQYFHLVNLFGAVPLVLTTDYNYSRKQFRSTEEEVYTQLISDLKESVVALDMGNRESIRVNTSFAKGLLSKIYLYIKDYENAALLATDVIENGGYHLEAFPSDVFKHDSKEVIFSLIPVYPGSATTEGASFIPVNESVIPKYIIHENLLSQFEESDLRKEQWIGLNIVNDVKYYFPYKYKMRMADVGKPIEKQVIFRLAELLLIKAEANIHLNNLELAITDINKIRNRAGLTDLKIKSSQEAVLQEVYKQRQLELMCEWGGNRWYDLKRTGKVGEVMNDVKGEWDPSASLYPIPLEEIKRNPFLTQNKGY